MDQPHAPRPGPGPEPDRSRLAEPTSERSDPVRFFVWLGVASCFVAFGPGIAGPLGLLVCTAFAAGKTPLYEYGTRAARHGLIGIAILWLSVGVLWLAVDLLSHSQVDSWVEVGAVLGTLWVAGIPAAILGALCGWAVTDERELHQR